MAQGSAELGRIPAAMAEQNTDIPASSGGTSDLFQPQVGQLIASNRAQKGLSQEALAKAANVDIRTVRNIEQGGSYQPIRLGQICQALELRIEEVRATAERLRMASVVAVDAAAGAATGSAAIANIARDLDEIDRRVLDAHGGVLSPTRAEDQVAFSSRRLVASLSVLDIPLDVILLIVSQLPDLLRDVVGDGETFTTAHIRSSVARAISSLDAAVVQTTDSFKVRERIGSQDGVTPAATVDEIKFDWASRYARRYGNPDQIIQVLERDGSSRNLDYAFLKTELIPHALRRLLGSDFKTSDHPFLTKSVISEMAKSALEEIRRLGLYTVRYLTALYLIEDLALYPPHPWVVTPETRMQTVMYDLERGEANLTYLTSASPKDPYDISHRYGEVLHHLCSAILALYGGFLGHRETSSIHLLRQWLRIEDQNVLLWRSCDLQHLNADLAAIGRFKQDFAIFLKRLDYAQHTARHAPVASLVEGATELTAIVRQLLAQRQLSSPLEHRLLDGQNLTSDEFILVARQTLQSYLNSKRPTDLLSANRHEQIGLMARLPLQGSVLDGHPPLCVVIPCLEQSDPHQRAQAISNLFDQVAAHRLSNVGLVLTPGEVSQELRSRLLEASAGSSAIVAAASLTEVARMGRNQVSPAELLDHIFAI